ncbi:replication-relaxation family protein [Lysinibacillus xylanilyticus]|uniref:replication-relaxation family protein n=1 Tax=Lysinibacillus xylanilyticus TaxID=582475 RepID=UPI002B2462C4|nr:replication-relaxation family protein [Lysinibacillus xylanilyticus]MEB2280136.1 replication-relaxation family protein [Lysinibacillus xylanilyticus]
MTTQNLSIESFVNGDVEEQAKSIAVPRNKLSPTNATTVPYKSPSLPRDILQYLPPNGNPFSLFGDPYAQLYYLPVEYNVIRNSQYWLRGKEEDNNFTAHEIALLTFLAKHRVATRSQIQRTVFTPKDSDTKIKEFLRKCLRHGIIVAFKWVSPCESEKRLPHLYGLSPIGAKAASLLLPRTFVPRSFQFLPIQYVPGNAPKMTEYFTTIIANEFYCKLRELDRVIEWSSQERFSLPNGRDFKPHYSIKTIKDAQDFKFLWLEIIRPVKNWYSDCIERFQQIQLAFTSLSDDVRPELVILLVDDVSRIPDIAELAEHYMPDSKIRFTTDERLIQKNDSAIFYTYFETSGVTPLNIKFLTPEWKGMSASEYHKSFYNEEMLMDDADYDY